MPCGTPAECFPEILFEGDFGAGGGERGRLSLVSLRLLVSHTSILALLFSEARVLLLWAGAVPLLHHCG